MIHDARDRDAPEEQREASGLRLGIWLGLIGTLILLNYAGRYLIEAPESDDSRDVLYEWSTFAGALIQFGSCSR